VTRHALDGLALEEVRAVFQHRVEWRRPVTRIAEAITVIALLLGGLQILFDTGRADRLWELIVYGRFQSPIIWDLISISLYLCASIAYLYVAMVPDIATLRDKVQAGSLRKRFYTRLALGWTGTDEQRRKLDRAITVLMVAVIPLALSVHTWVFGLTLQPMWPSTIFGPYFVMGALFSGIAAIIVVMAVLRKAFRLDSFLKPLHFRYLGILLLVLNCLWFYFTFAQHLSTFYGNQPSEMAIFVARMSKEFAPEFWAMVVLMVSSFLLLVLPSRRTVAGTTIASVFVVVGMWLERFVILVPTQARPRLGYPLGGYSPTWVEWSLLAGSLAAFALLYALFTRLFPVISIWEVKEGHEAAAETATRLDSYQAEILAEPAPVGAATPPDPS
jgi:molybdopterin-containing oxidoreductase family membrane subunit